LDAAFLALESPTGHLHALGVVALDPRAPALTRDELEALIAHRLPRLEPLRRRVVDVPGGLDRPWWIEVRPELHRHVHEHLLRGDDTLERFCAELAGRPLDRTRPLWEMWLVSGLPSGGQALVAKLHHSLCDGIGALALVAQLFDERPTVRLGDEQPPSPVPDEAPPAWPWLLARAACHLAGLPLTAAATALELVGSAGRLRTTVRGFAGAELAVPLATPHLSFHGPVSAARVVALRQLPLDRVRAVARASGTHVNDVLLAVLAGALRRWLDARDELPDRPLVAAVPVSTRLPDELFQPGNHVSACFVHLPTDRSDPRERLAVAAAVAASGKAIHAAVGATTLEHLTSLTFPLVLSIPANLYQRSGVVAHHPAPVNLVVSNVAGPATDLYLAGRRVTSFHALGPIFDGVSLNVTAVSYGGLLSLATIACPDLVDELDAMADAQEEAFEELADAFGV
jgi:diacylglycerol O-acyltransferase